jgi:hypothetical protein
MSKTLVAALAGGAAFMALPSAAAAQMMGAPNGSELYGQPVSVVTANGQSNTITFQPDGSATISSATGEVVPVRWSASAGQLCLQSATARECVPYQSAFQPQQAVTLTSDCGQTAQWTALSTNQPAPPTSTRAGERG